MERSELPTVQLATDAARAAESLTSHSLFPSSLQGRHLTSTSLKTPHLHTDAWRGRRLGAAVDGSCTVHGFRAPCSPAGRCFYGQLHAGCCRARRRRKPLRRKTIRELRLTRIPRIYPFG